MDSRRILLVSHEMTLSGAPLALFYLGSWLQRKGWHAVIAAPELGPISDLLENSGIRLEVDSALLTDPKRTKLRLLCRETDIVIANTITTWAAAEAAHRENIPVVWYIHETQVAARLIKQISQIRDALDFARLIVVPTKQTARVLDGATRTRIEIVPYGIPEPPKIESTKNGKAISFVTLGSFEPRKGQDILVDAIGRLDSATQRKTSFRIAGRILEQPFFADVQKRAAKLKNVELIDSLSHAEALGLLANSDAMICSSRDETMPIAIIEAASLRKSIISADVGGIGEWIHDGLNGFLVPAENSVALSDAIVRCAQDQELRDRFGAAARRTYERHFLIDCFRERFTALIEEAIRPEVRPPPSAQLNYERWRAASDNGSVSSRLALSRRIRQLPRQPLISILLPVYNPDLEHLRAAIESVKNQLYQCWELCLADDASTEAVVRPFLEETARSDRRIKVILRERNGHISACSNSALTLATGEWCALLDQDDVLAEPALAFVALEIAEHPDAGLIYSDEDKIDNAGVLSNPFFKTDWNPQLFLGQNYINHLGVYRTALLRQIGGFREGYEGSQDYDLALRCIERLRPDQVRHIPRILYHWRMAKGSLAAVPDAKPYAKEAARRAIGDHLARSGIAGRVVACPENIESHRVIYEIAEPEPKVSFIIPTRDRVELLEKCIRSLKEKTAYARTEFIVVDNESIEPATHKYLQEFSANDDARVVTERGPFNFSRLINLGAAAASGEILAFLNNDIEADEPGWLHEMVSHARRAEVGAVGARLWYPGGTLQHGGAILGLGGAAGHAFQNVPHGHPGYFNRAFLQQNYSAVTAACMLVRKKVFADVHGFDETNLAVNFNDVDFCLRLRERGLQIVWTPYANLIHHESASRGHHLTVEQQSQFLREATYIQGKWGAQLLCDPFYNPNFSLNLPGFDFAFPPRTRK